MNAQESQDSDCCLVLSALKPHDLCIVLQVDEPRNEPPSPVWMSIYACQRPTPLTHHNTILSVSHVYEKFLAFKGQGHGYSWMVAGGLEQSALPTLPLNQRPLPAGGLGDPGRGSRLRRQ